MNNNNNEQKSVVIVGAGPTGLTLAIELHRHGIHAEVYDQRPPPELQEKYKSKAITVHARTLEQLEDMDLVQRFLAQGIATTGTIITTPESEIARIEVGDVLGELTPYNYVLMLPQYETEAILQSRAQELNIAVHWNHRLTRLTPSMDHTALHFATAAEQSIVVHTSWLVACDGARGDIRHQLHMPSKDGADLHLTVVMISAKLNSEHVSRDKGTMVISPQGALMLFPEPGGIYRVLMEWPYERRDEVEDEPPLEFFQTLIDTIAPHLHVRLSDDRWRTKFELRQRMLAHFRAGRVLFAGDAAHSHSPAGGQGMNTGMQDAYNLAWRLALVVRGIGRSELIDAYCAEREAIASKLLQSTGSNSRLLLGAHSAVGQTLRNTAMMSAANIRMVRKRIARGLGMLDLSYAGCGSVTEYKCARNRWTDWMDMFSSAPQSGDRCPNVLVGEERLHHIVAGTQHTVLIFGGLNGGEEDAPSVRECVDVCRRYAPYVRVLIVCASEQRGEDAGAERVVVDAEGALHTMFGAARCCAYVVRPDKYLGHRSFPAHAPALVDYFARVFF